MKSLSRSGAADKPSGGTSRIVDNKAEAAPRAVSYAEQILSLQKEINWRESSIPRGRGRLQGYRKEGATLVRDLAIIRACLGTVQFMETLDPILAQIAECSRIDPKCEHCTAISKVLTEIGR